MTVRTPAKVNKELEVETDELEHEAEDSDVENSENDEEMLISNENDEADTDNDEDESKYNSEGFNTGWADAFAKVLQQEKPKNKKYLVLSRAKKITDKKDQNDDEKKITFEIADKINDDEHEEDIKPNVSTDDTKPAIDKLELALIARKERNNKLLELRVKPGSMDRERERGFKRIATKGVVQLFNAVRTQQRNLVDQLEKAGPLDHRRDEVLNNINKRQFLDMLMGGKRAKSENVDNPVKDENDENADSSRPSQWSVLRDDFMTNKKLKHWDNEDEDDGSNNEAINNNSMDSDSD